MNVLGDGLFTLQEFKTNNAGKDLTGVFAFKLKNQIVYALCLIDIDQQFFHTNIRQPQL